MRCGYCCKKSKVRSRAHDAETSLKTYSENPRLRCGLGGWKTAIYNAVADAQWRARVRYSESDKLDVEVCFYLRGHKLTKLDLDNRMKQVGDALQGFINDKGAGGRTPIIPNDNQIYRLTAEKRLPAKQNLEALSTITIRAYNGDARTVADPRETRKHPH